MNSPERSTSNADGHAQPLNALDHAGSKRPPVPRLIWVVPLAAALLGVVLIVKSTTSHGPTITISFITASGLEAGKTRVKIKAVDIGSVRAISLSHDLSRVIVTVQLSANAAKFAVKDSRFWVVQPRFGASGVSGLSTLLSGPYIAADAGRSKEAASDFTGLETPPAVTIDEKGHRYKLRADTLGSLDVGAPIFFRRQPVGQVIGYSFGKDGMSIDIEVFVRAPFDRNVVVNTRWWRSSGVNVTLGANGINVKMQSLASILAGGVAFEAPQDSLQLPQAPDGTAFNLAVNQAEAMREPDGPPLRVVMYFNQSLRGLSVGAPVVFQGIALGEVTDIGVEYDPRTHTFAMPVTMNLYAQRLQRRSRDELPETYSPEGKEAIKAMVARGLRGQLHVANVLTGRLYVALNIFPRAKAASADFEHDPIELPTVPGKLTALQRQMGDIAARLDRMSLEEMGNNINEALKGLNQKIVYFNNEVLPPLKGTLQGARWSFAGAGNALQQDSPFQVGVHQTFQHFMPSLQYLNAFSDYLERHPESLLRGNVTDGP